LEFNQIKKNPYTNKNQFTFPVPYYVLCAVCLLEFFSVLMDWLRCSNTFSRRSRGFRWKYKFSLRARSL